MGREKNVTQWTSLWVVMGNRGGNEGDVPSCVLPWRRFMVQGRDFSLLAELKISFPVGTEGNVIVHVCKVGRVGN